MFSLNRVQIIGYITQPVELRKTPGGQSVADLNVATPYTFKAESGESLGGTGYHSVTAWGGMAEVAAQYLKPGAQVFLSGRLQTDSWEDEKSGEKRSKTRIVAMDMILLDPRAGQISLESTARALAHCLNRADVVGNLTRDPELRTTSGGQNVVTLGIATNEHWKDKATNEDRERTEFHNVVVWGELAQLCAQNLKKGMRAHAAGRVQTRSWETKQGSKRTTTEIIAESISALGVKNADIAYSNESRAKRQDERSSPSSPSEREEAPTPAAASTFEVPEISYESGVKVEDLPF